MMENNDIKHSWLRFSILLYNPTKETWPCSVLVVLDLKTFDLQLIPETLCITGHTVSAVSSNFISVQSSILSSLRIIYYNLQGTRKTRPYLSGRVVWYILATIFYRQLKVRRMKGCKSLIDPQRILLCLLWDVFSA